MSLFEKLKTVVASMQGQQDFSYLKGLDQAQLQSLTMMGNQKQKSMPRSRSC